MPDRITPPKSHPALVGTAGWSIPRAYADRFGPAESGLQRYAQRFDCVEINSSFHRPHRRTTYERWAAATPERFRFSVKLPKEITHVLKLRDAGPPLERFLEEAGGLGDKLSTLLIQLPPSLAFEPVIARDFFRLLRGTFGGAVVCEARHPSWFAPEAGVLMDDCAIGRVLADPPPCTEAGPFDPSRPSPYYRLHGSPRIYYSDYPGALLETLAATLASSPGSWCMFDNTASGAAMGNALRLSALLGH